MEQWKGIEIAGGTLMNVSQTGFLEIRIKQLKERFAKKIFAGGERTRRNELDLM